MSTAKERVCDSCRGPMPASSYLVNGMTVCYHCFNREWLKKMADAEDKYESVSVGGLAVNTGQITPSDDGEPITREWAESTFGQHIAITDTMSVWIPGEVPVLVINRSGVIPPTEQVHDEPLYECKTRGQLRQLLAALGWRGEEKG